ncbi:uncharacterized protein LOC116291830 [Actinia tenebrosa]|uniref:Uncharacterized protein LOC116291830 n=1 Tax=Actinia tenebrosa TaxID=6105 RepID=A0A6P8HQE8_ACTTE|nr:uncharacterized protein LOC116291830 [Actinia tenebrosa]
MSLYLTSDKPKDTLLSPTKLDVCENKAIKLICTADAYPSVKNYSLYNGNIYLGSNSNGQSTTTARSLGWNKFCCVASNELGSGHCAFSDVYVLGNINTLCKINDENTSVAVVKEGDKVVLQCNVTGNESYYIYQWIKVKDSLSVRNDTRQLTFGSINRTDEGYYQVTLRDKLNCSSKTRSFNITVNYKPENTGIKITPDKKDFCEGESININCTSDANPAPVYFLYRNNVFNGSNRDGVFVVKLAENGNYTFTCVPNNRVGVGPDKSKSVTVKGK